VVLSPESSLPTHKSLFLVPAHVSRPWPAMLPPWMEKGSDCDCIAADRQAECEGIADAPCDGIRFALNFDVIFPPVLGTTLRFAETSYPYPSAASLPHLFALS
jgi:hypothetical protein